MLPENFPRQRLALIDSLKQTFNRYHLPHVFSVISWWEIHPSTCWRVVHWARVGKRIELSVASRAEHAGGTQRTRRHAIFVPRRSGAVSIGVHGRAAARMCVEAGVLGV